MRSAALAAIAAACAAQAVVPSAPFSIDAFGAVAGVDTQAAALANGRALASAMAAAAAATNSSRRGVLIPGGATYAYLPVVEQFNGLADVTLQWEGTLALYTSNFTAFPGWPSNVWPGMAFYNCSGLSIVSTQGTGLFNGRGNLWWWYAILVKDNRNNLLNIISTSDLVLQGVTLLNSPMYHAWISDVLNADISQVTVRVDENDQLDVLRFLGGADASDGMVEVLRKAGMAGPGLAEGEGRRAAPADLAAARRAALDAVAPAALRAEDWFPAASAAAAVAATAGDLPSDFMPWALNTDGIDVSGHNITVRNCSVKNWDDSVCVKPLGGGSNSAFGLTCSTDIAIHDIAVTWGVGITMGSVPPDVGGNCIDGVHAWNIVQDAPLKGIYIKPNPAKPEPTATGLIANVVYENMVMESPLWWSIWIGTQQQSQPGGFSTGCSFLYPLPNTTCPTDPQVTVANITLRNITINSPLLTPGVLLANASNPATGIIFDGVVVNGNASWPVNGGNYLCESVEGIATGGTTPVPPCFTVVDEL